MSFSMENPSQFAKLLRDKCKLATYIHTLTSCRVIDYPEVA